MSTESLGSRASALLRLLRPRQMTKNVFCLAGVVFGPGRITEGRAWLLGLATVVCFSLTSSAVYVLNDILDRERDRLHPRKRFRPIASGQVTIAAAATVAVVLALAALGIAAWLNAAVVLCVVLYFANNVSYSLGLKHQVLFDVLCISFGFILRLLAGIYAVADIPTTWITLCTFFLSTFLGTAKHRAELFRLNTAEDETHQRPVLRSTRWTISITS